LKPLSLAVEMAACIWPGTWRVPGDVPQRQGIEARVAKLPTSGVLRTHTIDETQGFMKALVAARNDRILGFTMIGAEASEVVSVVQTAILAGLPYTALPFSAIRRWRKDSALFSRMCRRGSRNSGAPQDQGGFGRRASGVGA
jgi:Pyridine nucleotide-disulphide oxidoreductase, dimerisation domain